METDIMSITQDIQEKLASDVSSQTVEHIQLFQTWQDIVFNIMPFTDKPLVKI